MTELSFLIDLLLNHKLPKPTKDLIAKRIEDVESRMISHAQTMPPAPNRVSNPNVQAASTLALMAKHGETNGYIAQVPIEPETVAVIAQTPQASAAMESRNIAIAESIAGKVDKTTGRPRKW